MSDKRRRPGSTLVSTAVAIVVILGAGLAGASQSGLGEIVAEAQRALSLRGTDAHVRAPDRLPPESAAESGPASAGEVAQPPGILPASRREESKGTVGGPAGAATKGADREGSLGGRSNEDGRRGNGGNGGNAGGNGRNAGGNGGNAGGNGGNAGGDAGGQGSGSPGGGGQAEGGGTGNSGGGSGGGGPSHEHSGGGGMVGSGGGAANDQSSSSEGAGGVTPPRAGEAKTPPP